MGEHRETDDVADRVDPRDVGPHLTVDGDEAALVHRDTGRVGADRGAVRLAPDRDQDHIEDLRSLVGECRLQAALLGADRGHAGPEQDPGVALGDALVQRSDEVGVAPGIS